MIALNGTEVVAFLLVLARVGAFIAVAPPLNSRSVPPAVKAGLAAALSLLMVSSQTPYIPDLTVVALVSTLMVNIFIGLTMGFVVAAMFAAAQTAGHFVDNFGGFALTFGYDPMSASQQSVFGRFYQTMAMALFMVTPAHAITLAGLDRSFTVVPLDGSVEIGPIAATITMAVSQMFLAALQIAAPLIGVLFVADIGLGLMTRVAPALNAFSLGFPLKMMLVLVLVGMTFTAFPEAITTIGERSSEMFLEMLGAG